jgi:hypothetical protein
MEAAAYGKGRRRHRNDEKKRPTDEQKFQDRTRGKRMPQSSTGRTYGKVDWRPAALCGKTQASQRRKKEKKRKNGPADGQEQDFSINAKSLPGEGFIYLFPLHTRGDTHTRKRKRNT